MKKQFLFLVFLVMAAFANITSSYGACTAGALNPAIGVQYTYTVTAGTETGQYLWFITKNVDLVAGESAPILESAGLFTIGSGSTYNTPTAGNKSLFVTWNTAAVSDGGTFYLVVKYTETSGTCTAANMRVWQVKPMNTFMLAIAGSDQLGVTANNSTCPADIIAAVITPATPSVSYTYDKNTIYYKITASGAIGTWTPSIRLPALAGAGATGQIYVSADWSVDGSTGWKTFGATAAGGDFTSTDTTAPVSLAGSTIIVRVIIDNKNYETPAAQAIIVGVDGVLPGGVKDIVDPATDCSIEPDFGKTGTYTINARPPIAESNPSGPGNLFIPKVP